MAKKDSAAAAAKKPVKESLPGASRVRKGEKESAIELYARRTGQSLETPVTLGTLDSMLAHGVIAAENLPPTHEE